MARYAIGDVQGCFDELLLLLRKINFNPGADTLWLTGDVVNRGPKSLPALRFVMEHEDCVRTVLGNHDLHLLAVAHGGAKLKKSDTLSDILNAPDCAVMLDWLRRQPMMLSDFPYVMVHAGLWPEWTTETALSLAAEAEDALRGSDFRAVLLQMYGNKPARYRPDLTGMDRIRLIFNVMTRMRVLTRRHPKLDFDFKSVYADIPPELIAWFDVADRRYTDATVLFGHWSALGLYRDRGVIGLDTGALWGGSLTAIDLDSGDIAQVNGLKQAPSI